MCLKYDNHYRSNNFILFSNWGGGLHVNNHFGNELDIHMSFNFFENIGYDTGLDSLTFLY